jgi:hypothetical protein
MNVGLVDEQDSVLGRVGYGVLDVLARGAGAGGVVGIADVNDAGSGGSGEHGLDVVRGRAFGIGQGHLDNFGASYLGGPHGRFIAGIGDHQRLFCASECEHRVVERLAGAGEGHYGIGAQTLLFRKGAGEVVFHSHQVASTAGNDIDHGLARCVARSEGILVGVNMNAFVGIGEMGALGHRQVGFGEDGHGGQGGGAGGEAEEVAAGEAATGGGVNNRRGHNRRLLQMRMGKREWRAQASAECAGARRHEQ